MLKVIDDIKISLSPLVPLELSRKICERYKVLRTTYKKNRYMGILSAKDEDDVPLFLKQSVSEIPLFTSSRRSLRNLDTIYTAMDELTMQAELKAGVIVKVEIFCGTFKAEYTVDDRSKELEEVIFETDNTAWRGGWGKW